MSSIRFGADVVDPVVEIAKRASAIRAVLNGRKLSRFELKFLKLDIYHEVFLKIEDKAYSTVSVQPKEDLWTNNPLHERIAEHMINDVYARTGLNIKELLSLPTATVEFILSRLRREGEARRTAGDALQNKIDREEDPTSMFRHLRK